jgi:hypothetical protein
MKGEMRRDERRDEKRWKEIWESWSSPSPLSLSLLTFILSEEGKEKERLTLSQPHPASHPISLPLIPKSPQQQVLIVFDWLLVSDWL